MDAFLVSTGAVALGEVGDKTQLLAVVLAARYRRCFPIILAILVATLANHTLAALLGQAIANLLNANILRWALGLSFLAMAAWLLVPESPDKAPDLRSGHGLFITTFCVFFLAEMGDKTQFATVALAAHYPNLLMVVLGSTLGMMCVNIPAVLLGEKMAGRLPERLLHGAAAGLFAVLGVLVLFNVGQWF